MANTCVMGLVAMHVIACSRQRPNLRLAVWQSDMWLLAYPVTRATPHVLVAVWVGMELKTVMVMVSMDVV